ncbi:MAG: hypothetical protein QXK03_03775 [Archaeoglobaceae archaeon]
MGKYWQAVIDAEKCKSCQTCLDGDHFDAIKFYRPPGSRSSKRELYPKNVLAVEYAF